MNRVALTATPPSATPTPPLHAGEALAKRRALLCLPCEVGEVAHGAGGVQRPSQANRNLIP